MKRRHVLKQIGAVSTVALGATGITAARTADDLQAAGMEYVVTEIDGESQQLSLEEFEQHPDTPSLSEVSVSPSSCPGYECCECCDACCYGELCPCAGNCGSCSGC